MRKTVWRSLLSWIRKERKYENVCLWHTNWVDLKAYHLGNDRVGIWEEVKKRTFSNKAKHYELLLSAQPRGSEKPGSKKQDTILKHVVDMQDLSHWLLTIPWRKCRAMTKLLSSTNYCSLLPLDTYKNQTYLLFAQGFPKSNTGERGQPVEGAAERDGTAWSGDTSKEPDPAASHVWRQHSCLSFP